jgi:hypothetical protein
LKNKKTPWYYVYGSQLLASDRSKNLPRRLHHAFYSK